MKRLELVDEAGRLDCDIPIYKDLPLPMIIIQGWFNDQHECFKLFFKHLTREDQSKLFTKKKCFDSTKEKYKELSSNGVFDGALTRAGGVHKRPNLLKYGFAYWLTCVFNAVERSGSVDALVKSLGTVEMAHDTFKPWFRVKKVRGLNAADAARILARYGYLKPESKPLLARGALRGAAIHLNNEPPCKTVDLLDDEYAEETKRAALEQKAAVFISKSLNFPGKFQMEMGESWFCNEVHKRHLS